MSPLAGLFALLVLVLLTKIPVAVAMQRCEKRGYNNRTPRQQQALLTGWGARALGAHQNTFEALGVYTAAVVAFSFGGSPEHAATAATLALVHTIARVLYPVFYIADVHVLRSLVWSAGYFSALGLAFLGLR